MQLDRDKVKIVENINMRYRPYAISHSSSSLPKACMLGIKFCDKDHKLNNGPKEIA